VTTLRLVAHTRGGAPALAAAALDLRADALTALTRVTFPRDVLDGASESALLMQLRTRTQTESQRKR
jgi:ABC-type spermidine/putrescine transport system permease subunit II